MTFAAFEGSQAGGEPVELYEILLGGTPYRWTSSEDDYTFQGNLYSAIPISRTRVFMGTERKQDLLTVVVPASEAFPKLFVGIVPGERAVLTVKRVHRPDPDQEHFLLFDGVVQAVAYSNNGTEARLAVASLTTALGQEIPRKNYGKLCDNFLFDGNCQVVQSLFKHTNTASVVLGAVVTVDGLNVKGDGWADGGFVELGSSDFRLILSHVGDDITLLLPFPIDIVGSVVGVSAGCAHTISVCKDKFDNVNNYGGWAFVPLKNPFEVGLLK